MSEEEKKKPFLDPNGLYGMKNTIGALYVLVGVPFALLICFLIFVGVILFFSRDNGGELFREILAGVGGWKIDIGLAIILGSTIISGAILLSGIRKE